jgi:hypothetical protein
MRSCQGELGSTMIESGRIPGGGAMTLGAIMTEIICDMVGVGNAIESGLMARIAVERCILIPVSVTRDTGLRNMCPGQRKSGISMAECRWLPGRCGVADGAYMIEIISYMIWIGRAIEIGLVTGETICRRILVS